MGASAMPMPGAPQGGFMGGLKGGLNDFLGSDASLAMAAGLLGGGSTSQAIGRGFAGAGQAMAGDRARQAEAARENRTVEYFQKMDRPDLAEMVLAGGGVEAFKALQAGSEGPDPASVSNITAIRKEFEASPGVKRYRTAVPVLSSMAAAVDDTSTMADLDFIYGMAKIFDPESVVRESEMGLVIQGQSLPAQVVGMFNKVANGEQVLLPQIRKDLVEASRRRVGEYEKQAAGEAQEFTSLAERNRIDPRDVVRPLEQMPAPYQPTNPAPPPTATGPNGEKLMLQGGQWVPYNGQ
jgi:hypothetical protein